MSYAEEIKEEYNPRTLFEIASNKEDHYDSPWLCNYTVERKLNMTRKQAPFVYTDDNFYAWLDKEYEKALFSSRQDHFGDSGILPSGRVVRPLSTNTIRELLLQKAPQNVSDGAFLSQTGTVGPCDEVEALLHKIKYEEAGGGVAELNHCNWYIDLLESLGYQMLPYNKFADDSRLLDISFDDPAYQLAIARFPRRYKPEIIGMTLFLEWTGTPEAFKMKRMLEGRNIDASFYSMHVIADNRKTGHAHDIRAIIPLYLKGIRSAHGEEVVQQHWQRIFQGYTTWGCIIDNFERELAEYLVYFENVLDVA